MFFFKKKQKMMKAVLTPNEDGVHLSFQLHDGKTVTELQLPMAKEEIENYYKLQGFPQYIAWEELYDSGVLVDSTLPYREYYELLKDESAKEVLQHLGLPNVEEQVSGKLSLRSLPHEADLVLQLFDANGRNLDRIGKQAGAIYVLPDRLMLLPERVYRLKQALLESYESGYEKIGICQQLANEAGIELENFLQNETYHVVDTYDVDVAVHRHDHIELVVKGRDEEETRHLQQLQRVSSVKKGHGRSRFVSTKQVHADMMHLQQKRHITGEEVPLFLENPAAVLPEHDYLFDLDQFSERVRGLIPIERVRPFFHERTGMQWFDEESGHAVPYDEAFLRELMEQYPDQQYVEYNGKWIYLDPLLRRKLLQLPKDADEALKRRYILDIKDNEEQLEYKIDSVRETSFRRYPVPSELQAALFPHQMEGFEWLCHLAEQERGGLLADDMGLGKTIQVIAFLLHQKANGSLKPTLIVLPIALIENWVAEIEKFAPSLLDSLYIHKGSERLASSQLISQFDIILTSYDTLKIDQLLLGKIEFQAIICDEAQNIKSHTSQRSRAIRAMQGRFRLAMTGTPVENSLDELWAIMDFVQPGALGSLKEFRFRYTETSDYDALLMAIQPYYLRRTKQQILDGRLPKKHLVPPIYVEASPIQKEIARSMLATKESGQVAILNMITRLRQLYGHPGAIIPKYEQLSYKEVPKLKETMHIIEAIRQKGEKALIFTEFRKLHFLLKRIFMETYGISVPVIDGDTKNRQLIVQHFNETQGFGIMILSPKAAGVGLTITSANHVIHYTRWWNPAVENQATDRAYRIGQQKDVYVYHIITRDSSHFPQGTVEELMHELLESKRHLAENVIIPFNISEIQQAVAEKVVEQRQLV
ncbi:helicase [Geobacillus thermodenitrificans]|uniref:Patative DNA/RNA helicase SNF2 family n=2 Tax=Geobacillus thermodenitrificans TaxID=33940 RepID=A4IMU6_GEOTN|nr:Patative DNA/RNA helicase SNF2 family [Geobacillus thermodenitrificans NG80-2]ATO36261.1 helicase [Geobacillus thermodenitrificans]KQB93620.1 helicase [Geobacillus sp. PA-3]MED0661458.1 ATP-dependent helicase [Geobacillus thermodenitrificans]NNU85573.1 DEAD/DEAH box helicase [Geobacillus sp. MR]